MGAGLGLSPGWHWPRIFAHRGGGTLAPENTLGAIRHGAALGFGGVEFDVMLAGDGTPVLIHDERLERTTDGKGEVSATAYPQLAMLDAGRWAGERWTGERIPAFVDAAALCLQLGLSANVEIKPALGFEVQTGRVVAQYTLDHWRGVDPPPLLSSFSIEALQAAREVAPSLPRGWLVGPIPKDWRTRIEELGCVALHCNWKSLNASLAAEIRSAGYGLLCWTVNEAETARRLLGWGVDCIVTDRLDLIGPGFS